jgi:hypothetical protein
MMWLDWWWLVAVLLMMAVTNYAIFWPPLPLKRRILLLLAVMVLDMGVTVVLCVEVGASLPFTVGAPLIVALSFAICIYNLEKERRRLETLRQNFHQMELEELKTKLVISRFNLPFFPTFVLIISAGIAGAPKPVILLLLVIGLVLGYISSEYFLQGVYRQGIYRE